METNMESNAFFFTCLNRVFQNLKQDKAKFRAFRLSTLEILCFRFALQFTLIKTFSSKFKRNSSFYRADYGNSVFYLTINMALLTTLHVIGIMEKVQKDVAQVENNTNKTNVMFERIIQDVTQLKQGVNKSNSKHTFLSFQLIRRRCHTANHIQHFSNLIVSIKKVAIS